MIAPAGVPILDHRWGAAPAADRIWAQVSGLAPRHAHRRLLMILQAFIDDSYVANGCFVLAGYIAEAGSWAKFAAEWEEMLPYGTLNKNGKHHFKMNEMAANSDRMKRLPGFIRIIENHVLMSISIKVDISQMQHARNRIWVPGIPIIYDGVFLSPYMLLFGSMLDILWIRRDQIGSLIPWIGKEKIDFIFDNQAEKSAILAAWELHLSNRPPSYREFLGATPRFEDDQDFLPLQAADCLAWWTRKWEMAGAIDKIYAGDFEVCKMRRDFHKIHIQIDEENIITNIKKNIRSRIPRGTPIYDVQFFWNGLPL